MLFAFFWNASNMWNFIDWWPWRIYGSVVGGPCMAILVWLRHNGELDHENPFHCAANFVAGFTIGLWLSFIPSFWGVYTAMALAPFR